MLARPPATSQRPDETLRRVSSGHHRQQLVRPGLHVPSKLSYVDAASQHEFATSSPSSNPTVSRPTTSAGSTVSIVPPLIKLDVSSVAGGGGEEDALDVHIAEEQDEVEHHNNGASLCTPFPLPSRPSMLRGSSTAHRSASRMSQQKERSRLTSARRAEGVKAPPMATALSNGKAADFFPWTGTHPEDVLNEHVIKSGYADKPPGSNQSESHTARPSLWPTLKNKSGLPVLSALFVQVMEKRQALGRCNAPSTFKPPPRVTLTDTKREAWLRDLASSDVPLRRLSRTIPHGIRGKTLLDQCLGKEIPLPRAVWLAKCVGANEMRAFRRKGASGSAVLGGELKWIRDWTVFVEHFIEGVIAMCGQERWQAKMNYAIRLATLFFSENLLDAEHYFDWLLTSLESSSTERLPVWLVITQIYWKHLVAQQRLGRHLSHALLAQLDAQSRPGDPAASSPLITRLQRLVIVLATAHSGCMIAIKSFQRYSEVIKSIMSSGLSLHESASLRNVVGRNRRLLAASSTSSLKSSSPLLHFIEILDSFGLQTPTEKVAQDLRSVLPEADAVITLLRWASSTYRQGQHRVYLAASIIGYWKMAGADTDSAIIDALSHLANQTDIDRGLLHKVVAELVLSQHFVLGKYLQMLIAVGAVSRSGTNPCASLLASIPITSLPTNVLNLRRSLLQRLDNRPAVEAKLLQRAQAAINELLQGVTTGSQHLSAVLEGILCELEQTTGTIKYAMGDWISSSVLHDKLGERTKGHLTSSGLGHDSFLVLRTILERIEDYGSLSNVLVAACASDDPATLACVADTITQNADMLAAMDLLSNLTVKLFERQRDLRSQQPLDRTFLKSLLTLLQLVTSSSTPTSAIISDLKVCEQQGTAAACSPASDSMIEHTGSLTSDDDINRVLSSGNSMDEQLLARMFSAIVDRASKANFDDGSNAKVACRWFSQLRLFDQSTFDNLVKNLLIKLAGGASARQMRPILVALTGSHCATLDDLLLAFERRIEAIGSTNSAVSSRTASQCLELVLPPTTASRSGSATARAGLCQELYRFQLAQALLCRQHSARLLRVLRLSLEDNDTSTSVLGSEIVGLSKQCAISDGARIQEIMVQGVSGPSQLNARLQSLFDSLLKPTASTDLGGPQHCKTNNQFLTATELSLPFCRLALSSRMHDTSTSDLVQLLHFAMDKDAPLWPQFMDLLPPNVLHHVHEAAIENVHRQAASFLEAPTEKCVDEPAMQKCLDIACMTSSSIATAESTNLAALDDKLKTLRKLLINEDTTDGTSRSSQLSQCCFWIQSLLRLVNMQYQATDAAVHDISELGRLLVTICTVLVEPKLQLRPSMVEILFDAVSLLSSKFSAEQMNSVIRHIPPAIRSDSRVAFLLGCLLPADAWLSIATRVGNAAMASQTSSATSQPMAKPLPPQRAVSQSSVGSQYMPSPQPGQLQRPQRSSAGQWGPEIKYAPYSLRRWEIIPDPTPNVGEK